MLSRDRAKEAIRLIVDASGEVERLRVAVSGTVAEGQAPQAINRDGLALLVFELPQERAGAGIERIDTAIAKVAYQEGTTELTKGARRQLQPPGSVQGAPRCQPLQQIPVEIEDIHKTASRTGNIVVLFIVLLGIGDIELVIDVADAKRRIARRDLIVGKGPGEVASQYPAPIRQLRRVVG